MAQIRLGGYSTFIIHVFSSNPYYRSLYLLLAKLLFNIDKLLNVVIDYSKKRLRIKSILSILSNPENFKKDEAFELLEPENKVTSEEIRDFIIDKYKKVFEKL